MFRPLWLAVAKNFIALAINAIFVWTIVWILGPWEAMMTPYMTKFLKEMTKNGGRAPTTQVPCTDFFKNRTVALGEGIIKIAGLHKIWFGRHAP